MLEQMCRTCLATSGELVSIFSNDYYVHNLPDKLFNTIRIEVSKYDDLPKMMCKKCIFLVDSLYCFKDQCEMAEIKLKKTLKRGMNDENNFPVSTSGHTDKKYDKYILAVDHSDAVTTSEEEYDIEYASEEARLEVENARRQSRNDKKKRKNKAGVKVKSVEILPTETKDDMYTNFRTVSYKYDASEADEEINISDGDDRFSSYVSEVKRPTLRNPLNRKSFEPTSTTEKINFFKNMKQDKFQHESDSIKPVLKRKMESDYSYRQSSKVPKKVMFKDKNCDDKNIQFIEETENQDDASSETVLAKEEQDTIMQINVIENSTGKVVQNYDVSINEHNTSKNATDSRTSDSQNTVYNYDNQTIIEMRMQNLIKHLVLNIPEICAICSERFDTYLDVLKHKIEIHLSKNQDCFFCPICHQIYNSNLDLVDHLNDHKDVYSFICVLCSGNFYTEQSLRTHMQSHVDLDDMKCELCSRKFYRIQTLLSHLDQHVNCKQLVCTLCSENFDSKEMLQQHIDDEHRKSKCPTCGEKVTKEDMVEHIKSHTSYPCPYCEQSFSQKTTLRDHVFTHLGVQQYSCLVCEKTFPTKEERTKHTQEHMKPDQQKPDEQKSDQQKPDHQKPDQQKPDQQKLDRKKFRCRVCHEILISRVAYGQHLKDKHLNSKQTSDILRELSDSSLNEKLNTTPSTPET